MKKTPVRKRLRNYETDDDDKEWEVEKILDDRIDEDAVHYFRVKWKNFSVFESTWEPKKNLAKCKGQLAVYMRKMKGRK